MLALIQKAYMFLIYAFLYVPIILLAIYSFNESKYAVSWTGFTFDWYYSLISNSSLIEATINSLIVASFSATIATIIGIAFALWLYVEKARYKKVVHFLVYILVMSPDIIMGISLLVLFVVLQLKLGFLTLLMSHIAFELPFVVVTVLSRLRLFDKSIIEAAKDLGASDFIVFKKILIPLIMPSAISSWLLSFTLSLDDVVISFFVTGPGFEILPLKIYSMARLGVKPEINALCFVLFMVSLVLATISCMFIRRKV